MTRNEIKQIFPDCTQQQIDQIMDINGADINRAKGKYESLKAENESLVEQLNQKNDIIANFEKNQDDIDALKTEIQKYKDNEKARLEEEKEIRLDEILTQTANQALQNKKFVNDITKNHYISELKKAISDPLNKGKEASELFENMIKDATGIFENPQDEKIIIHQQTGSWNNSDESEKQMRAVMGLPPLKGD